MVPTLVRAAALPSNDGGLFLFFLGELAPSLLAALSEQRAKATPGLLERSGSWLLLPWHMLPLDDNDNGFGATARRHRTLRSRRHQSLLS